MAGPAPRTLIDPIHSDDLRRATLGVLRNWWAPILDNPAHLRDKGYQPYAVLTMYRILYTLQYGGIVSKLTAARWAQETLDEQWTPIMQWALASKNGERRDDLSETLSLIRFTLERSQSYDEFLDVGHQT